MSTLCCSGVCEKRTECKKHSMNNEGIHYVEDFYYFGSGSIGVDGIKESWWCGKLGDYAMFEPIEKEPEEKIVFPFQYLEQYFLGKIKTFDEAMDYTEKEVNRLIEEYVEKHNLKT